VTADITGGLAAELQAPLGQRRGLVAVADADLEHCSVPASRSAAIIAADSDGSVT